MKPVIDPVAADLIENENSSEDFYRDRCLRLHLPQAGDFRLGLIYVSPSNSVRASHCALQLKAWCAVSVRLNGNTSHGRLGQLLGQRNR